MWVKYVGKVCACVWVNLHLVTQMASLSDIVAIIERLSDCGQVWETVDRSWRLCEGWGDSGKVGKMVGRLSGEWDVVMEVGMLSRRQGYYQGGGDIVRGWGCCQGTGTSPGLRVTSGVTPMSSEKWPLSSHTYTKPTEDGVQGRVSARVARYWAGYECRYSAEYDIRGWLCIYYTLKAFKSIYLLYLPCLSRTLQYSPC